MKALRLVESNTMDTFMANHLIFGAGLIGCYLGGCFSGLGIDVQLLCRPTIKKKLLNGITLTDYKDNAATTNQVKFCESGVKFKVIWLTVKCTAVEQACIELRPYVGENSIIFCCQNGLGADQIVAKHFPDATVLRVMVPFNVIEISPGHFHRGSEGNLTLEQPDDNSIWVADLSEQLNSPLLPVSLSADMSALLWAKLQLNLGNSINALADIPVKTMLEQRPYRLVIAAMMKELLCVAKAKGIKLPKIAAVQAPLLPVILGLPDFLFKRIANKMLAIDPSVRTSMWWDISLNKKTEIDYLNGAIMSEAKTLGLNCSVNSKVTELIKQLEVMSVEDRNNSQYPYKGYELLQIVTQC